MKISNKYLEIWLPDRIIEYLLVAFIACSAVLSATPGRTATDLPTNALTIFVNALNVVKTGIFQWPVVSYTY